MKMIKRKLTHSYLPIFLTMMVFHFNHDLYAQQWFVDSEIGKLRLEVVADNIEVPYGMTFLSDTTMLVTNRRTGEIIKINCKTGRKVALKGVPTSFTQSDSGALDILSHPSFDKNGWVYFSHSIGDTIKSTMAIDKAKLVGDSLIKIRRIFTALPYFKEPNHYGTRIVFQKGYLYFGMGDRYDLRDSAQMLGNHLGKIMRVFEDGRVPHNNPFVGIKSAQPEIWSYGHRNPQGLVTHPLTKELWENEHGPRGGDEVNIIHSGLNYGWPIICYGIDYDGTPIGKGITHQEGLEQPIYHYTPSIAPSGMEFYFGNKFPKWRGNLFIGAMALQHLNRLVIEKNKVVHEERLLKDLGMRVRIVKQGPDGYLYLGVDGGKILRIKPL